MKPPVTYLAKVMIDRGVPQAKLARQTGASKQSINKLFVGNQPMSAKWAKRIAPCLGIDWVELLEGRVLEDRPATGNHPVAIFQQVPSPGDPIRDTDEALLLAFWRTLTVLRKASVISQLGFDELPSLSGHDLTVEQLVGILQRRSG